MTGTDFHNTETSAVPPTLQTSRLSLRPFSLSDARDVQRLAGDRAIAETTLLVPHPYEDGMAEAWIEAHAELFANGHSISCAVVRKQDGVLIGAAGLSFDAKNHSAELGYWIGQPYWGNGYCTEASRALLQYGFRERGLHKIHAKHFTKNPASGRVMQKLGMQSEGIQRQHILKWGVFEDVTLYGLLASDFSE